MAIEAAPVTESRHASSEESDSPRYTGSGLDKVGYYWFRVRTPDIVEHEVQMRPEEAVSPSAVAEAAPPAAPHSSSGLTKMLPTRGNFA